MTTKNTLTDFLAAETACGIEPALAELVRGLARVCAELSGRIARASALGIHGDAGVDNIQGEAQKKLDVIANDLLFEFARRCQSLAAVASEEEEDICRLPRRQRAPYLLAFDPLDGSSNVDTNVSVGTIFSVLRFNGTSQYPLVEDFLQPGTAQVCAGYVIYGPSTVLALTLGRGTHLFAFDWKANEFVCTTAHVRVPEQTSEFAINMSNRRFWEAPVRRYIDQCLQGASGPRGRDFNMRWIASLVAEAQRVLSRGGIFMYPRDTKEPRKAGRLRLLYEANPIAFLMEQAGAAASTGRERMLGFVPESLHQRVPLIFGSKEEVERVVQYHSEASRESFGSPLFSNGTLFVQ